MISAEVVNNYSDKYHNIIYIKDNYFVSLKTRLHFFQRETKILEFYNISWN